MIFDLSGEPETGKDYAGIAVWQIPKSMTKVMCGRLIDTGTTSWLHCRQCLKKEKETGLEG
jgi:hypothetical protein